MDPHYKQKTQLWVTGKAEADQNTIVGHTAKYRCKIIHVEQVHFCFK